MASSASEKFIILACLGCLFLLISAFKSFLKETNKIICYDSIKGMTLPIEYHLV